MGRINTNEYTLEFNDVMDYMTSVLYNEFPTNVMTLEYFLLSILDNRNCHAHVILDNCLMSNNLDELRKIYVSALEKHMKPQLKKEQSNITKFEANEELSRLFEACRSEAKKLNSNLIGTEHALLAILNKENRFKEGKVLDKFRLEYDFIFDRCHPKDSNGENQNASQSHPNRLNAKKIRAKKQIEDIPLKSQINTKTVSSKPNGDFIKQFAINLNELARNGKIDEIVGRKDEINEVFKVLSRRKKNNAILVGKGGCGTTAIVYGIANMIENGNVPNFLQDKEIIMLNPIALVSGTHFRGMFEERVNGLFNDLKKSDKYVLFIDDIHTVLKSGSKEKDGDLSGLIGDMLSEGAVKIIATTTFKEYRNSIESNISISRKFQKIIVEASSIEESINILDKNKKYYEEYHNVTYTNEAIKTAVKLASRYISDRSLPDSAFDVIDLAGASTSLTNRESEEVQNIKKRLKEIENEKEKALNNGEFEIIDSLNIEYNVLKSDLTDIKRDSTKSAIEPIVINENDIANIVSEITKIPITKLNSDDKKKVAEIDKVLKKDIVGQDEAIEEICKVIKRNKVGLSGTRTSVPTFLLCGPSGVGKSLLAKKIAEQIYGDENALIRLDMSEYSEKSAVSKLHGCFTPDMLVLTEDGSYKPISEIKVGDKVITPNGNIKKVTNKFAYDINEEIDVYKTHCFGLDLKCTKGHNILTIDHSYYNNRIDKKTYSKSNAKFKKSGEINENNIFVYPKKINYHVENEIVFDLVKYSKRVNKYSYDEEKIWHYKNHKINRIIKLNKDFARFLGYYVSEGGVKYDYKCITFTFNINEKKYHDELLKLISTIFGIKARISHDELNHSTKIWFYSQFASELISTLCGRECHIKKIPLELMHSNSEIQHNFLETAIFGDGTKTIVNKLSYTSASLMLASQINTMFKNCGYSTQFIPIICHQPKKHYNYRIIITGNNVRRLNENLPSNSLLIEEVKPKLIQRFQYNDDDYYYYQIKSKSNELYNGKVYDLTIEDDSSYIVNGVSVHNSSPGYIGYDDGGILTSAIKNKPYSVVLLDEIEKADESIYNVFLQVFDEGRLTEGNGNLIDCRNCIFIMTSNIGARRAAEMGQGLGFTPNENENKKSIINKELKKKFTPEFLNRIDKILYFNNLSNDNLKNIVKLEINKLNNKLNNIKYNIIYTDDVVNFIHAKAIEEKEYGARPINRLIQTNIEDKITELMLENDYEPNYEFSASCINNEVIVK